MHGALRGKGLGRSVCPTGGMCGRSPAEDRQDEGLWVQKISEEGPRKVSTNPNNVIFLLEDHCKAEREKRTMDFVLVLFFFFECALLICLLPKGFQITAPSPHREEPLSGISPLLTQLP